MLQRIDAGETGLDCAELSGNEITLTVTQPHHASGSARAAFWRARSVYPLGSTHTHTWPYCGAAASGLGRRIPYCRSTFGWHGTAPRGIRPASMLAAKAGNRRLRVARDHGARTSTPRGPGACGQQHPASWRSCT
eukprot:scaffold180_cov134-Isochrysis_galbana.AAC.14